MDWQVAYYSIEAPTQLIMQEIYTYSDVYSHKKCLTSESHFLDGTCSIV